MAGDGAGWRRNGNSHDGFGHVLLFYACVLNGAVYRSPQPEAVERHTDGGSYFSEKTHNVLSS